MRLYLVTSAIASATLQRDETPLEPLDTNHRYSMDALITMALHGSDFNFASPDDRDLAAVTQAASRSWVACDACQQWRLLEKGDLSGHARIVCADINAVCSLPDESDLTVTEQDMLLASQRSVGLPRIYQSSADKASESGNELPSSAVTSDPDQEFQRIAKSLAESLSILPILSDSDYDTCFRVMRAKITRQPVEPATGLMDPTEDIIAFTRLLRSIFIYRERYFTDPAELEAYEVVIQKLRKYLFDIKANNPSTIHSLYEYLMEIKSFIRFNGKSAVVEQAPVVDAAPVKDDASLLAKPASDAYETFKQAALAVADLDAVAVRRHANAKLYTVYRKHGFGGVINKSDCKINDAIDNMVRALSALAPLRKFLTIDPKQLSELDAFREAALHGGQHIKRFKEASPQEQTGLIHATTAAVHAACDVYMEFGRRMKGQAVKERFMKYILSVQKLTIEDFKDHVRRFGLIVFSRAGFTADTENRGRIVGRIVQFKDELQRMRPYKEQIFAGKAQPLAVFNEVENNHMNYLRAYDATQVSPTREKAEEAMRLLQIFVQSLYDFVHPVRVASVQTPVEEPVAKRPRVESISTSEESVVVPRSEVPFELAPPHPREE